MALPAILSNDLVKEVILPFLLIFVLIFAILDRTKILGEDKRQINALISLAIALIFVTFGRAVGIVNNIIPFLAVAAVVILVFLVLYGFVAGDKEGLKIHWGIKVAAGIIILVGLIIAVLVATNTWDRVVEIFKGPSNQTAVTIVFILVMVGAVAVVLATGKKSG